MEQTCRPNRLRADAIAVNSTAGREMKSKAFGDAAGMLAGQRPIGINVHLVQTHQFIKKCGTDLDSGTAQSVQPFIKVPPAKAR